MTSSVDGLISGLNTTQLISQLMQVEAQSQTTLKSKVKTEQTAITAYQAVNSKLAALQTAAEKLTKPATWQAVTATSSSTAVVATAAAGTAAGGSTFDVTKLARAHIVTLTGSMAGGLDVSTGGGPTVHIVITSDTLAGVAAAINASSLGLRASVITTDSGSLLQVAASHTGFAAAFVITGTASPPNVAVQGTDAQVTIGDPLAGGYTASSATNTFTDVVPGVTFTATQTASNVTISIAPDAAKIADNMQALVDATNAAMTEIGTRTAYDATSKTPAALTGNFTVRQLEQNMLSSISNGQTGYGSFTQLGVSLSRDGTLSFDRTAFLAAYQADPVTTQSAVAGGLATALQSVAKKATDPTTGSVTLAIQSRNDSVRSLNNAIGDWDVRLQTRQGALQRQYSHLEVALGQLKNQSAWLSGQIASLPSAG
ncbi:MAG TPA: flagellar filament capping protein FliD [Mycobacteriales bacterium]|nr:flagellar filament capping protein FliD [Mycobacteriales bacterium]